MAFDYNAAKQAGYSDQEIQGYLSQKQQAPQVAGSSGAPTQTGGMDINGLLNKLSGGPQKSDQMFQGSNPFGHALSGALGPGVQSEIDPTSGAAIASNNMFGRTKNLIKRDIPQAIQGKENLGQLARQGIGSAGELATYPAMGLFSGALGGLGGGLLGSMVAPALERGAAGVVAGGIHGLTDPTNQTVKDFTNRGLTEGAFGGVVNPVMGAIGDIISGLFNKNTAELLAKRQFGPRMGTNLKAGEKGMEAMGNIMENTQSMVPEKAAAELAPQLHEMTTQIQDEMGANRQYVDAMVTKTYKGESVITGGIKGEIVGRIAENPGNEFDPNDIKQMKILDKYLNPLKDVVGKNGIQTTDLYNYYSDLGDKLGNVFDKARSGVVLNESQQLGVDTYHAIGDLLKTLHPDMAPILQQQSMLISGGNAMLNSTFGNSSMAGGMVARRLPLIGTLPFDVPRYGLTKDLYAAGKVVGDPTIQALRQLLPAAQLNHFFSPLNK